MLHTITDDDVWNIETCSLIKLNSVVVFLKILVTRINVF